MGRWGGWQEAPDRHPGPDGQTDRRTDRHTHTRQNLYIFATWAVKNTTSVISIHVVNWSNSVNALNGNDCT